jgi:hypothetical protein
MRKRASWPTGARIGKKVDILAIAGLAEDAPTALPVPNRRRECTVIPTRTSALAVRTLRTIPRWPRGLRSCVITLTLGIGRSLIGIHLRLCLAKTHPRQCHRNQSVCNAPRDGIGEDAREPHHSPPNRIASAIRNAASQSQPSITASTEYADTARPPRARAMRPSRHTERLLMLP